MNNSERQAGDGVDTQMIDLQKLREYKDAFILYEIVTHSVDPRTTLDNTTMRISSEEGYKDSVYADNRRRISRGGPYVDLIINALPGVNLVSHYQENRIVKAIEGQGKVELEKALTLLYERDEDEQAFNRIVDCIGGAFDVLAFIFFLKDDTKYLPIRSRIFDERFALLGIDSQLAGKCSWNKYEQYNSWIKEIHRFISKEINGELTLLDAHSFVWILPKLDDYINGNFQVVEHSSYGLGILQEEKEDTIVCKFGEKTEELKKDIVFNKGILSYVDLEELGTEGELLPEELKDTEDAPIFEGAKKTITVNTYERDSKAIKKCKSHYMKRDGKIVCQICGFDFSEVYGQEYANKIHVHHIRPLSEIDEEYEVDPVEDLIPVCPNCHMVLHSNGGIDIDELRKRVRERKISDREMTCNDKA